MTVEALQNRRAELQAKRDSLEHEAVVYEKAAKEKRAQRDKVKVDLAELGQHVQEAQLLSVAQKAAAAAEQARLHAEAHATELEQMRRETKNILEHHKKLIEQLEQQLADQDETSDPVAAPDEETVSDGDS